MIAIIVTATQRDYRAKESFTEERVVKGFKDTLFGPATELALDQPLKYDHRGDGDYRGEVANLSRNVIVESADPHGVRGHTMYHRDSAGSISYAEFRHLGKEGVLGRYRPALSPRAATPCAAARSSARRSGTATIAG